MEKDEILKLAWNVRNQLPDEYWMMKDYTESWHLDVYADDEIEIYVWISDEDGERKGETLFSGRCVTPRELHTLMKQVKILH